MRSPGSFGFDFPNDWWCWSCFQVLLDHFNTFREMSRSFDHLKFGQMLYGCEKNSSIDVPWFLWIIGSAIPPLTAKSEDAHTPYKLCNIYIQCTYILPCPLSIYLSFYLIVITGGWAQRLLFHWATYIPHSSFIVYFSFLGQGLSKLRRVSLSCYGWPQNVIFLPQLPKVLCTLNCI